MTSFTRKFVEAACSEHEQITGQKVTNEFKKKLGRKLVNAAKQSATRQEKLLLDDIVSIVRRELHYEILRPQEAET